MDRKKSYQRQGFCASLSFSLLPGDMEVMQKKEKRPNGSKRPMRLSPELLSNSNEDRDDRDMIDRCNEESFLAIDSNSFQVSTEGGLALERTAHRFNITTVSWPDYRLLCLTQYPIE